MQMNMETHMYAYAYVYAEGYDIAKKSNTTMSIHMIHNN